MVKQDDGIVLLESPLSGTYVGGILDKARADNPGQSINAVLSTSDSWPHVGGVRQVVALGLPLYVLDLNRALLERLIASPRRAHPDLLARSPRAPVWKTVSGKMQVGTGAESHAELSSPCAGALCTERQYMVYFPEQQLLYASDTLALNADGSLYAPELMREVMDAVKREHLRVTTVFAMHQTPVPWTQVTRARRKSAELGFVKPSWKVRKLCAVLCASVAGARGFLGLVRPSISPGIATHAIFELLPLPGWEPSCPAPALPHPHKRSSAGFTICVDPQRTPARRQWQSLGQSGCRDQRRPFRQGRSGRGPRCTRN